MKFKYRIVNTKTLEGLKEAEKLKRNNWKIINIGLYEIIFEKKEN